MSIFRSEIEPSKLPEIPPHIVLEDGTMILLNWEVGRLSVKEFIGLIRYAQEKPKE